MKLIIENFNLQTAEKRILECALTEAGSITQAAKLLGITHDSLKRRIVKYNIRWVRPLKSRIEVTIDEQVDSSDVTGERRASAGVSAGDRDKDGNLRKFLETARAEGATKILVGMKDGAVYDMTDESNDRGVMRDEMDEDPRF